MDRWTGLGEDGGTQQGKGREEAGRGQPEAGRDPQQIRLLGFGHEQQRKGGTVVRDGGQKLSSGEYRREVNGLGIVEGGVLS